MNVRPTLLTVYETHFVPLGERLRPALNGLLAGVLLGLEEGADKFYNYNYQYRFHVKRCFTTLYFTSYRC